MAELVHEIFTKASEAYGEQAWSTMAVQLLEDQLDEPLRAPGFPAVLPETGDR